jgi:hypothetical protein
MIGLDWIGLDWGWCNSVTCKFDDGSRRPSSETMILSRLLCFLIGQDFKDDAGRVSVEQVECGGD